MDQVIFMAGLLVLLAFAVGTWFGAFYYGLAGLLAAHAAILVTYFLFGFVSSLAGVYEYDGLVSLFGLFIQAFLLNCMLLPIGVIALWMRRPAKQVPKNGTPVTQSSTEEETP